MSGHTGRPFREFGGFLSPVVRKFIPTELVLRDQGITELYVQDKLTRVSSFSLLRVVAAQVEAIFPDPLARGVLPNTVLVGPCGQFE